MGEDLNYPYYSFEGTDYYGVFRKPSIYEYPWITSENTLTATSTTSKKFDIEVTLGKNENVLVAMCDSNSEDLSAEHILRVVESMKAKIMCKVTGVMIDHFECKMTPEVRKTIVKAWKKLNMYGKQPPFIPRYDANMNKLPEKFNVEGGLLVEIVDPEEYGEQYFELDAIRPTELVIEDDISYLYPYDALPVAGRKSGKSTMTATHTLDDLVRPKSYITHSST